MIPVIGLFSDFWIEIGQCAYGHDVQCELRLEQCRFPLLLQWKIEGTEYEYGEHLRSWMSRSFKNILKCRLGCDETLSSCRHLLHLSVPIHVIQCDEYVVQHPNVVFDIDTHILFDEVRRENDAVHHRDALHGVWVALSVLVDARIGIETCLSWKSPMGSDHVDPAEEFLVGEHHARPRASNAVCHGESTPTRYNTSQDKFNLAMRFFRPSFSASVISISGNTCVIRHFWCGTPRRNCLFFVLMLSSDHSDCVARISRDFRPSTKPLAQLSNVMHCPINATTHGAKIANT